MTSGKQGKCYFSSWNWDNHNQTCLLKKFEKWWMSLIYSTLFNMRGFATLFCFILFTTTCDPCKLKGRNYGPWTPRGYHQVAPIERYWPIWVWPPDFIDAGCGYWSCSSGVSLFAAIRGSSARTVRNWCKVCTISFERPEATWSVPLNVYSPSAIIGLSLLNSILMARFLKQSFAQTCLKETDNGKLHH